MDTVQTYHDGNCPKCDFPETIDVRNAKTMDILYEKCSLRTCGWTSRQGMEQLDEQMQKDIALTAVEDITFVLTLEGIDYVTVPEDVRKLYFKLYNEGMKRALLLVR